MVLQKYSRNYSLYAYFAGTSAPHLEHVNKSSASGAWVTSSQSDLASIKSPSSSTSQVWVTCAVVMNVVLPHFGQGPIFRLAVIVVNSFLSCVRANKKRQTHPKVNLPSMCEIMNFSYGPNGAIDGIYRTAFIISLSQAVSTKKPPHSKRDEGANIIVSFLFQPRSGPRNRRPSG